MKPNKIFLPTGSLRPDLIAMPPALRSMMSTSWSSSSLPIRPSGYTLKRLYCRLSWAKSVIDRSLTILHSSYSPYRPVHIGLAFSSTVLYYELNSDPSELVVQTCAFAADLADPHFRTLPRAIRKGILMAFLFVPCCRTSGDRSVQ